MSRSLSLSRFLPSILQVHVPHGGNRAPLSRHTHTHGFICCLLHETRQPVVLYQDGDDRSRSSDIEQTTKWSTINGGKCVCVVLCCCCCCTVMMQTLFFPNTCNELQLEREPFWRGCQGWTHSSSKGKWTYICKLKHMCVYKNDDDDEMMGAFVSVCVCAQCQWSEESSQTAWTRRATSSVYMGIIIGGVHYELVNVVNAKLKSRLVPRIIKKERKNWTSRRNIPWRHMKRQPSPIVYDRDEAIHELAYW